MLKRIAMGVGALFAGVVLLVVAGLVWAHVTIRRERTPLPDNADIAKALAAESGPVRLSWINTGSQVMPRSSVLDPDRDPSSALPYVMAHPSFVLEYADGRILLVDAGMTREGAAEFGQPLEEMGGADPMKVLTPVAEGLGAARSRVKATIFSHLHTDHVGGMPDVCRGLDDKVKVFMNEAQMERPNYTTRPGRALLENTDCVRLERLGGVSLKPVEGFPGVFVVAAAGHTPGSQIVLAAVGEGAARRLVAFVGDTVNNVDGVTYDVPKPLLYRLLIVPEDETRQTDLRHWLRDLHDQLGFVLLPAHDQQQIERSGIPAFTP
jgi:glyoxylase-like metal-dependent hydrolase (beta-lactamase superfamily II)